jgi:hypothetical protein
MQINDGRPLVSQYPTISRGLEESMAELRISDPKWLRERADHCRDLAGRATSVDTTQELLEMAEEYEANAANIEREQLRSKAELGASPVTG